ncbi:MAG TPA: hypothetical protein VMW46_03255 [Candidatus Desulfaltia sp.]|nr:hypothetical protein [Candidatus Desulfaltia sp.]
MATKVFLVTISATKRGDFETDEKMAQLEASFINIIQEINMTDGGGDLKVTSIVEQE